MSTNEVETFVGIAVSKSTPDLRIDPASETLHMAYDEQGIKEVCQRLAKAVPALIVLEATGGLETRPGEHDEERALCLHPQGNRAAHGLEACVQKARPKRHGVQ